MNLSLLIPLQISLLLFCICAEPSKIPSHSIPKQLWIFSPPYLPHFQELNLLHIQNLATYQNYSLNFITQSTYSNHLSPQNLLKIQTANNSLIKHFQSNQLHAQNSPSILQNVLQRLIVYAILAQNGGVFIDHSVTLLEPLDSFFDFTLQNNSLPNGGHFIYQNLTDYCIAFYNDRFSSVGQNFNHLHPNEKSQNQWVFKPYIVLYPNLEDYFIACTKGNLFMQRLYQTYTQILTQGKEWPHLSQLHTNGQLIGKTNPNLIFQHGHLIASHWILQKQQETLSQKSSHSFAIRTLGFITINDRLGPKKIRTQFSFDYDKIYLSLAKLTVSEFQLANGPLRSIFRFDQGDRQIIERKLRSFENPNQFWVQGSFAHEFWIRHIETVKDQPKFAELWKTVSTFNIVKNPPQNQVNFNERAEFTDHTARRISFDENKPKWQSLDKNIWIIWDDGVEGKSNLIVELCYENLKKVAGASGFKFQAVSKSSISRFLSKQMLQKIGKAVENCQFDLSQQALSDLWRMALIYEHGGVYFDASTFSTNDSFDWIVKIPQIQQNLIWNRYGKEPEVFMLWNSLYGSPLDWQYDSQNHTRSQWHLSYENNFIVASKGAQLIKQWLDTMLKWIQIPYNETEKKMREAGMIWHKWTWESSWSFAAGRYLTAMDSLKYVLGNRQILLKQSSTYKNSAHYYKIWSMPGQFIGQQKLRGDTNYEYLDYRLSKYDKSYNTIYKYQFPVEQIELILGPIEFQGKFFSRELAFMNKLVEDSYESTPEFNITKLYDVIHPKSLLAKVLFDNNLNKTVSLIKYYSSYTYMQRNLKAFSKVWTY